MECRYYTKSKSEWRKIIASGMVGNVDLTRISRIKSTALPFVVFVYLMPEIRASSGDWPPPNVCRTVCLIVRISPIAEAGKSIKIVK